MFRDLPGIMPQSISTKPLHSTKLVASRKPKQFVEKFFACTDITLMQAI